MRGNPAESGNGNALRTIGLGEPCVSPQRADALADINQIGILLLGVVLGWLVMFAVRRYRVQWGAFATFIAVVFGVGILMFYYKIDVLGYYGIGIFLGFFANTIVRAIGVSKGGKTGEALTEISTYKEAERK